ncbi:MAG: 3-hydroxyacyl-ACP dehydratase FabZ [Acetobacteraceae bacterium]|nr:3-hydroxyacyl-ACP dehydratase FabZ [Acetobacteraceae bacterium]
MAGGASERPAEMGRQAVDLLGIRGIMGILPHRYPFLMVDKLLELEPDRRARGIKNVTINEPYFLGHFPGNPVLPGVMLLESMAQIGGMVFGRGHGSVLLQGMDRVRFEQFVLPGDTLEIEAECVRVLSRGGMVKATASVNGKRVARAHITFVFLPEEAKASINGKRSPRTGLNGPRVVTLSTPPS